MMLNFFKSELMHTDFSNRWFVARWDQCLFKRTGYNQRRTHYNGFKISYPIQVGRKFLYYTHLIFIWMITKRLYLENKHFMK